MLEGNNFRLVILSKVFIHLKTVKFILFYYIKMIDCIDSLENFIGKYYYLVEITLMQIYLNVKFLL